MFLEKHLNGQIYYLVNARIILSLFRENRNLKFYMEFKGYIDFKIFMVKHLQSTFLQIFIYKSLI